MFHEHFRHEKQRIHNWLAALFPCMSSYRGWAQVEILQMFILKPLLPRTKSKQVLPQIEFEQNFFTLQQKVTQTWLYDSHAKAPQASHERTLIPCQYTTNSFSTLYFALILPCQLYIFCVNLWSGLCHVDLLYLAFNANCTAIASALFSPGPG